MKIKDAINKVVMGRNLSLLEAEEAMREIMEGRATDSQIAALITALRLKGETVDEIVGCAKVMREKAIQIESIHPHLVDTCGTGGDGSNTFNISTTVAFVLAGGGVAVAKHGNRAISSKSGSADLLEELGVRINLNAEEVKYTLDNLGIGFLFAPLLHGAMKYALTPRREIGIRTIFNLLGPLTNPAKAESQILGVYNAKLTETLAQVLNSLGSKRAFVVHGNDGLDEISLSALTRISELKEGKVSTYYIDPKNYGLKLTTLKHLQGGTSKENAMITREILKGEEGPCRDIVLLNSAFGFLVADKVKDIFEGLQLAAKTIDSGAAMAKLEELIELSHKLPKAEHIAG